MTFSPHGKIYIQGGTVTKSLYEIDTSSGTYINLGQMKYKADGDLTFFNDTLYMSGGSGYLIRVEFTSRKPNSVKEIVIGYMKSVNAVGIVTAKLNNRKTIIVTGDSNSLYEVNRFNCKTKFICKSILDTKLYNIVGAASSEETTTFPSLKILKKNVLCDTIFRLNADDGWETYLWNTGEKAQSILIDKSGKYWVEAIYEGYKVSDTINVSIEKKPYSINAGNDTFICQFQTATLTARGGNIT
ncbi:MAG: hypothetical protein NTX03_12415, partial [Bacteroidetes bacterium]|nr:hypothetical protein [Bacteroidota bacterium]